MELLKAAVARFVGIEPEGFGRWQAHEAESGLRVNIKRYDDGRGPHAFLIVRPDWQERVHETGLDRLKTVHGVLPPLLVLHAEETYGDGDLIYNRAAWTLGGRTIVGGWIARCGSYWGTGAIEPRAIAAARRNAKKAAEIERDLKILGEMTL